MIVPLHWAHTAGAAGWGAQGAKMEPVKSRMTAAKPAAFTQPSSSFGSTLNSFLLILLSLSLFSSFLFHKSLSAPHSPNSPQTFKSGLMFEGDELLSSAVWVGWQGSSLCREEPEAIGVHGHVHGRRQRLNFTAQDSPTLKWRELNGLKTCEYWQRALTTACKINLAFCPQTFTHVTVSKCNISAHVSMFETTRRIEARGVESCTVSKTWSTNRLCACQFYFSAHILTKEASWYHGKHTWGPH